MTVRLWDEAGLERANATITRDSQLPFGRGWLPGDLVRHDVTLSLPADLPPGPYTADLLIANAAGIVLDPATAQPVTLPLPPVTVAPALPGTAPAPPAGDPVAQAGSVSLAQVLALATTVRPGQDLTIDLIWTGGPGSSDLAAVLLVLDTDGQVIGEARQAAGAPGFRTRDWPAGTVLRNRVLVPISREATGGPASLLVSLEDADGPRTPLLPAGTVGIDTRQASFDPPVLQDVVSAEFGGLVRLTGLTIAGDRTASGYVPGSTLAVDLAWEALRPSAREILATVQLLDAAGRLVTQQDRVPGQDGIPLTEWIPGEFQVGQFLLTIPRGQAGSYRLVLALYDPTTGTRLSTGSGNTLRLGDILVADGP